MAELAENILREIQETTSDRRQDAVNMHIEMLETFENNTLSVDDIGTKVKDAAEAEAAAIVIRDKATEAKAAVDKAEAIANRGVLGKIHGSLSGGFSQLGSSIKSDFSMMMAPLTLMAQAPGMKTIITLVKIVGMWLAKLFLHLITKKLFSGLRKTDAAGSLDVKATLGAFGDWSKGLVGIGPKKDRLTAEDRAAAVIPSVVGGTAAIPDIDQTFMRGASQEAFGKMMADKENPISKAITAGLKLLSRGILSAFNPMAWFRGGKWLKAKITSKMAQKSGVIGKGEQQSFDFPPSPKEKDRKTKAQITPKTAQKSGVIGKGEQQTVETPMIPPPPKEKDRKTKAQITPKTAQNGGVIGKEKKKDPARDLGEAEEKTFTGKVKGFYKSMSEGWGNIKEKMTLKFEGMKNKVKGFYEGMSEGWDNIKEKTAKKFEGMKNKVKGFYDGMSESWGNMKEKLGPKFKGMKNKVDSFHEGMNKGWDNIKKNTAKKFMSMKKGVTGKIASMGRSLKSLASGMLKAVKGGPMKALKLFQAASRAVALTFKKMGKAMMGFVKRMVIPIARLIIAGIMMVATMIASAFAMILPALPIIAIIVGIVLLVAGLIWLGMKIVESWDRIKERFSIAMEQLSIWGAQAANWLGGMFAPMEDKVKYFFAMLMDGLASMVNAAIDWINDKADIFGIGYKVIKDRMTEGNVDAAVDAAEVRAAKRAGSGEEIAERQAALDDRKAAYDAAGMEQPTGDINQQNVVVNQSTTRKHISQNTQPTDVYGGNAALAQ